MAIYASIEKTLAKLQSPLKFGKVVKYFLDKAKTKWILLESIKGDTSSRWGSGKPGRRKEVDVVFTLTKSQWLAKEIQPPEDPVVVQDVVPQEGHTIEVDGQRFLISGVDTNEIAYTLTTGDPNR